MTTVILIRHGRSTANTAGILAGRSAGVNLDDTGTAQAAAVAGRLAGVRVDALVSSPMDRCRQTLAPLAEALGLPVQIDDRLAEVDYGSWTGRALKDLGDEPLWRTVQQHPSAAVFPDGEGLAQVSARTVAAVRDWALGDPDRPAADDSPVVPGPDAPLMSGAAARAAAVPGQGRCLVVCSHGDVIKAILADALGMHLDAFQRIVVNPASVSVIRYTPLRPFVERVNDTGDLGFLRPPPPEPVAAGGQDSEPAVADPSDAVPGGTTR
ncbi:histidine phosphatase family protein [Nakamurella flavida]|uniref:histidine phosphatase family protein n=1 Tax=Nakamurella flavida TaxID=363630 RepID=UPI0031E2801F